jgi:hypothetical protein
LKLNQLNQLKGIPMKQHFLLGAAALLCTIATSQAAPTNLSTSVGKGADTSVRGGSYTTRNFGSLNLLKVCNLPDLEHARKAYLRFDLSSLPSKIKDAKSAAFNLVIAPAEGKSPADKVWTFQVSGLKDGDAGEDWAEGAVSWDNAPASDPKSASALTDAATPLGTFTITGKGEEGKTVSFSSPELLKFLQADSNGEATLIITRVEVGDFAGNNVVHEFASKENGGLAAPGLNVGF